MLTLRVQHNSFISPNDKLGSFGDIFNKSGGGLLVTVMSKKGDFQEKSNEKRPVLQIKVPNTILARSAIAVLGLGFIDAGYSGDWSRIGAISKETEELLKISAFLVVPLSYTIQQVPNLCLVYHYHEFDNGIKKPKAQQYL